VKDEQSRQNAVLKVTQLVADLQGQHIEVIDSPILGMEGNKEFLLHAEF
jgi:23S rRNA (cytidine1920-2'-O)/16S rRNA (cytidine1409-2'-O)-methyltransferase